MDKLLDLAYNRDYVGCLKQVMNYKNFNFLDPMLTVQGFFSFLNLLIFVHTEKPDNHDREMRILPGAVRI